MNNKIKTVLFASLIVAMILPFSIVNYATAQDVSTTVIDKAEEPTEFVGTLSAETRQIGSYLLVKHTYTSGDLNIRNVDHIYREEIVPVNVNMTQQEIDDIVNNPEIVLSHEMVIIHEDGTDKIDRIQSGLDTVSAQAFQQWNIVEMPDGTDPTTNPVSYHNSSIKPVTTTTIEDWASKKDGKVYVSHDPINLIWKDTISTGDTLISKVNTKIDSQGWDDSCLYSRDLYINISGTWTKQDEHFIDSLGGICKQYHVRAWAINDDLVIGSAHKEDTKYPNFLDVINVEHLSTTGPSTWEYDILPYGGVYHSLSGFDTAEDEAASEFSGGCWSISKDSHYLNNTYTRNYYKNNVLDDTAYNDGYATEILCS